MYFSSLIGFSGQIMEVWRWPGMHKKLALIVIFTDTAVLKSVWSWDFVVQVENRKVHCFFLRDTSLTHYMLICWDSHLPVLYSYNCPVIHVSFCWPTHILTHPSDHPFIHAYMGLCMHPSIFPCVLFSS